MAFNEETLEKAAQLRDEIVRLTYELAALIGEKHLKPPPPPGDEEEFEKLDWRNREGRPASPDDVWGWCFIKEKNGLVTPAKQRLIDLLGNQKKLVSGRYIYSMSADGRFFHRRKVATDQKQ